MAEYTLYHAPFHPTESLKKSVLVSETELPLQDDVSTIPRTVHVSSGLDRFDPDPEQNEGLNADMRLGYHPVSAKGQDQTQHQEQEQLTLLTSLNEQTITLLQAHSLSPLTSENEDVGTLEQVLVLGQIALILASSLYHGACAASASQAQSKPQEEGCSPGAGTQVVLALTNMGMALVKDFDRTGDEKDLEKAGVLYKRAVGTGIGVSIGEDIGEVNVEREQMGGISKMNGERETRRVKRREWKLAGCRYEGEGDGEDGCEDRYGHDEVLGFLDRLRKLLAERGFAA